MINPLVKDKNGKTLSVDDNVYFGSQVWLIERIVKGKLHLTRFGIKRVVDPDKVSKYR